MFDVNLSLVCSCFERCRERYEAVAGRNTIGTLSLLEIVMESKRSDLMVENLDYASRGRWVEPTGAKKCH